MKQCFDVRIAAQVGFGGAIISQIIYERCKAMKGGNKGLVDGLYWTACSVREFMKICPYLSRHQIRGALSELEEREWIKKMNLSSDPRDRTYHYAITEKWINIIEG